MPNSLFDFLRAVSIAIVAVGALGFALNQIYNHILIPLWRAMKALNQLAEAMPVLLSIAEEFRPNSGGSLRDAVDRIEESQQQLAKAHRDINRRVDAIESV